MTASLKLLTRASRDRYSVIVGGSIATSAGVLGCLLIAVTAQGGPYWSAAIQLVMYLLASIAMAGLVGLIFGVPRSRAELKEPTTERYSANSNLEEISDWLTKILVGAGLVQLAALPHGLSVLGLYLGNNLDIKGGPATAVAVVLYGMGVGFLSFYLWARLRLRVLLESTEKQAAEQSRRAEQVADSLTIAAVKSDTTETPGVISSAAARATAVTMDPRRLPSVLWVDDHPENNSDLVAALRTLGVSIDLALSTEEATRLLMSRRYGLIITDLGRKEGGTDNFDAGLDLIRQVGGLRSAPPIFVYAGDRGIARRDELLQAGAALITNRPTELFNMTVDVLTNTR